MSFLRGCEDNQYDLAIVDPPYGGAGNDISGENEIRNERGRFSKYKPEISCDRTGGDWAKKYGTSIKEWDVAPPQEFFDELFRISKNQIIWGGNYFSMPPTRCFVVWRKLSISDTFTMAMAEYAWTSFNMNAKVFEYPPQGNPNDPRFHPCQKPVELYGWLLDMFAKEGDTIFDPMAGSFSSAIASYKKGFDYTGIEIDEYYYEKGCERFKKECLGEYTTKNGHKVKEQNLFGW